MDDDLGRVRRVLHIQEQLDVFILLFALLLRMDFDHLALVLAFEEAIAFDHSCYLTGMRCVLGDDQHEWFHPADAVLARVEFKLYLRLLVDKHSIHELELFKSFLCVVVRIEVLAGGDRRLLDKPVRQGGREGIAVDDIPERVCLFATPFDLGRGRKLQAQDRLQLVDCSDAG